MRKLILSISALIGLAAIGSMAAGFAGGPASPRLSNAVALATPIPDSSGAPNLLHGLPQYAAACGLCTDVDCCGGTENGWKLCASDCPSGQYKCEQVAECE